jgi:hypothetical protein
MINSFDIFDTLIGRLCYEGKEIFRIIENKSNLSNFYHYRIKFESQTRNFEKTYELLEKHYKKNLDYIKKLEFEIEYEMSFPIVKYLKNVKQNDLLISDMYLHEEQIRLLLNKHKKINNKLYVSYEGKRNNIVWKNKDLVKNINIHYGDNIISDYNNPVNHNIKAYHIKDTKMNDSEKLIYSLNKYIAYIIRAVRLSLKSEEPLLKCFCEYALPFAVIVCFKIKQLVVINELNSIIFLSRDGYWFKELYNIIFPEDKTIYLYFSRLYVKNNPNIIKNQINNIKGKKFIFDLQGSGKTFNSLNLKNCFYFICFLSNSSKLKNYLYQHSHKISNIKTVIEDMFIAPHGSVFSYNEEKKNINLLNPEHNIKLFEPYFEGIKIFKNYYNIIKKYISFDINFNNLQNVVDNFYNNIEEQIILKKKN